MLGLDCADFVLEGASCGFDGVLLYWTVLAVDWMVLYHTGGCWLWIRWCFIVLEGVGCGQEGAACGLEGANPGLDNALLYRTMLAVDSIVFNYTGLCWLWIGWCHIVLASVGFGLKGAGRGPECAGLILDGAVLYWRMLAVDLMVFYCTGQC